jgi:hypothetical protein
MLTLLYIVITHTAQVWYIYLTHATYRRINAAQAETPTAIDCGMLERFNPAIYGILHALTASSSVRGEGDGRLALRMERIHTSSAQPRKDTGTISQDAEHI